MVRLNGRYRSWLAPTFSPSSVVWTIACPVSPVIKSRFHHPPFHYKFVDNKHQTQGNLKEHEEDLRASPSRCKTGALTCQSLERRKPLLRFQPNTRRVSLRRPLDAPSEAPMRHVMRRATSWGSLTWKSLVWTERSESEWLIKAH